MPRGKRRDYSAVTPDDMTTPNLLGVVKQMANVANKRIWSLNKAGLLEQSGAAKMEAKRRHDKKVTPGLRFRANKKMSREELEKLFFRLRDFLNNPESRAGYLGKKIAEDSKEYEKARSRGYKGGQKSFQKSVQRLWVLVREGLLSSDIAYYAMQTGGIDYIDYVVKEAEEGRGNSVNLLNDAISRWEEKNVGD